MPYFKQILGDERRSSWASSCSSSITSGSVAAATAAALAINAQQQAQLERLYRLPVIHHFLKLFCALFNREDNPKHFGVRVDVFTSKIVGVLVRVVTLVYSIKIKDILNNK